MKNIYYNYILCGSISNGCYKMDSYTISNGFTIGYGNSSLSGLPRCISLKGFNLINFGRSPWTYGNAPNRTQKGLNICNLGRSPWTYGNAPNRTLKGLNISNLGRSPWKVPWIHNKTTHEHLPSVEEIENKLNEMGL